MKGRFGLKKALSSLLRGGKRVQGEKETQGGKGKGSLPGERRPKPLLLAAVVLGAGVLYVFLGLREPPPPVPPGLPPPPEGFPLQEAPPSPPSGPAGEERPVITISPEDQGLSKGEVPMEVTPLPVPSQPQGEGQASPKPQTPQPEGGGRIPVDPFLYPEVPKTGGAREASPLPPSPGPLPPPPLPEAPLPSSPGKAEPKDPAPNFPLSHVLRGAGGRILALVYWDPAYRGYVEVYPGDRTPDGWRFVERGGRFFLEKEVEGKLWRYSLTYRERAQGGSLPLQELVLREEKKGTVVRMVANPRAGGSSPEERGEGRREP